MESLIYNFKEPDWRELFHDEEYGLDYDFCSNVDDIILKIFQRQNHAFDADLNNFPSAVRENMGEI